MNQTQTQIVNSILSVDLSTVDSDRLVELCVIHRANPEAHAGFPAALQTELERRFDDAAIRADDTVFAVLETFAAQFQKAVGLFAIKLREMAASINRDIWFTDNEALFKSALADADTANWIAENHDILEKILNNSIALPWVAQSETAATAILTKTESLALWKNTANLWNVWPNHAAGMKVVAKSSELMQYTMDTALDNVLQSATAMQEILAVESAANTIINAHAQKLAQTDTVFTMIGDRQHAADALAKQASAMQVIAASEPRLRQVVASDIWRKAFMAANTQFQAVRATILTTITGKWTKKWWSVAYSPTQWSTTYNSLLADKGAGLVFATLGRNASYPTQQISLYHPNNTLAATAGGKVASSTLTSNDAVSFDKATIKQHEKDTSGNAYAEIWVPN